MKHIAMILFASMIPVPAAAQDQPPMPAPEDRMQEGADLLERGMRSILEGFFTEMQPAIEDMGRALTEMRPMAEELLKLMDNIGNYDAPVVLENGDILIRRKPKPPEPLKEGEVEL
jgi:hypothetical protein